MDSWGFGRCRNHSAVSEMAFVATRYHAGAIGLCVAATSHVAMADALPPKIETLTA